jgi:hypothetical protein
MEDGSGFLLAHHPIPGPELGNLRFDPSRGHGALAFGPRCSRRNATIRYNGLEGTW